MFNHSTKICSSITNDINNSVDEIFNTLFNGKEIGPVWGDIDTTQINLLTAENVKGVCYFAVKCYDHPKEISQMVRAKSKPTFAFSEFSNPNTYILIWVFDRLINADEYKQLYRKFAGSQYYRVVRYESFIDAMTKVNIIGTNAFNTGVVYSPETLLNPTPTTPDDDNKGGVKSNITNPETSEMTGSKVTLQIQSDEVGTYIPDATPSQSSNLGGVKSNITTYTPPVDNITNSKPEGYIPSRYAHEENDTPNVEQANGSYARLTGIAKFDEEQITQDLANMGVTEFANFVSGIYPYFDRTDFAGRDYIDTTNEDYFEIYREGKREERTNGNGNTIVEYTPSLITGKKRTSLLYTSCIIRRLINPNVGYAQLLANTVEDVVSFYDYTNDNVLCPREIARTVARVMMMTSKQLKAYPIKRDTRRIVTNPELTNRKSIARIAKGDITNDVYARTYDESKSDKQVANEMGVTKMTASRHRKRNNIPSKGERTRDAFASLYDATLTNAQMIDKMTVNGYPISLRTLQRLKAVITASNKPHQSHADHSNKETITNEDKTRQKRNKVANPVSGNTNLNPQNEETPQSSENKAAGSVSAPQMGKLSTNGEKHAQNAPESPTMEMQEVPCIAAELTVWGRCEFDIHDDEMAESDADNAVNNLTKLIGCIQTVAELNWCEYYIGQAFKMWGWVLGTRYEMYHTNITRQLTAKRNELCAA